MSTQTLPAVNGGPKPLAKSDPAPARFRQVATQIAGSLLSEWVGEERAREATGRIAAAMSASASAARNPADFYACTPQSIGVCVALSALTGIMPGTGSTALAYVYPRRPRKNEAPQLQYSLSHRGLNALAKRCGLTMVATPVGTADKLAITSDGEVEVQALDLDNPPTDWDELRGVMVVTKETAYGRILHRGWVPKKLIAERRKLSLSDKSDYSPWKTWPVEMAIKTAMHYAVSRGWCVIDDTEATRALSADSEQDYQDAHEPPAGPPATGRQSLRAPATAAEEQPSEGGQEEGEPPADEPPAADPHEQLNIQDFIDQAQEQIQKAEREEDVETVRRTINEADYVPEGYKRNLLGRCDERSKQLAPAAQQQPTGKRSRMF